MHDRWLVDIITEDHDADVELIQGCFRAHLHFELRRIGQVSESVAAGLDNRGIVLLLSLTIVIAKVPPDSLRFRISVFGTEVCQGSAATGADAGLVEALLAPVRVELDFSYTSNDSIIALTANE